MKLKTAVIALLGIIFLSFLATHYHSHTQNRALVLKYMNDAINSKIWHVKDQIGSALANGQTTDIQKILDKAKADDYFVDSISFSFDKKNIDYSSARVLIGKNIGEEYLTGEGSIFESLLEERSKFSYEVFYFDETGAQERGYILLSLDKGYIFGAISHNAWESTKWSFIVQLALIVVMLIILGNFFVKPINQIIESIKTSSWGNKSFFIRDFVILRATLIDSFWAIKLQKEELEYSLAEAKHLDEILRTVADVNQFLISSKTENELIQKSCDRLAAFGHYKLAWIGFANEKNIEVRYKSGESVGYLDNQIGFSLDPENPTSKGPSSTSVLKNKIVVTDFTNPSKEIEPWLQNALSEGFAASIAIPIKPDIYSKPFGTLGVYTDRKDGFDPKEINMLEELAGDIGFAINSIRQNEAFKKHLITDSLTALPNKTMLFDELKMSANPKIALINIDRFKDINEVYGYGFGDELIKTYSHWLQAYLRNAHGAKLYKLNGAEFVISFFGKQTEGEIGEFLQKLIKDSNDTGFMSQGIELFLNITIGFANSNTRTVEHAEMALKKAKTLNKHLLAFDDSMLQIEEQKNNIIWHKTIKGAVDDRRIIPYFQPIVDNKTGKIVKYEALMRLLMPNGEVVSPFRFLEISKKMRLYPELTKIMVEKSLDRFQNALVPVSINLSFDDIIERDIREFLYEKISSMQIGDKVIFEILESEGIKSYDDVMNFMSIFRGLGCGFAIDDFGSGYSNFDHILKLEVDTLKIDGSLIKNLPNDKNAQIIVKNINNFAKEMNIKTVAEFVCNDAVFEEVKNLGIDMSQGYHFYEPLATLID